MYDQHRCITIGSLLAKVLSMLIDQRLTTYFEDNGLRSMYQGGFRPKRGTSEQIFTLNHLIEAAQQRGEPLYCAFVDFKKAFDTVRQEHLWERLSAYGVTGNILHCIQSLYAQSQVAANVNGEHTDFVNIMIGVRQGDPLSPTLFGIFIELLEPDISRAVGPDWQDKVPGLMGMAAFLLLYADDVTLIAMDPDTLQLLLDALHQFCADWDMTVNLVKTKIVVFNQRRMPSHLHGRCWHFNQQVVELVRNYKYLGAVFDQDVGCDVAPIYLADSGRRALFAMQNMCYTQDLVDPSIRLHLWQQLVLPVVSYGSEVWGSNFLHFAEKNYFNHNNGEQVHLQFLRWYLRARPSTHRRILLQAANRLPLQQHWLQCTFETVEQASFSRPRHLASASGFCGEHSHVAAGQ
jgi:hypothetical protein